MVLYILNWVKMAFSLAMCILVYVFYALFIHGFCDFFEIFKNFYTKLLHIYANGVIISITKNQMERFFYEKGLY
jgi:hypothetical protein